MNNIGTISYASACLFAMLLPNLSGCFDPACDINSPPVVDAGADQTVMLGTTVTLDGSSTSDLNGDVLTYEWTLRRGPIQVDILEADQLIATVTPPVPGEYEFRLTARDGCEGIFGIGPNDSIVVEVIGEDTCGDGVCTGSETEVACPSDCAMDSELCGNGICESQENATICPLDCDEVVDPTGDSWVTTDDPYWPGLHPVSLTFNSKGNLSQAQTSPSDKTVVAILELAGLPENSYEIVQADFSNGQVSLGEQLLLLEFQFTSPTFGTTDVAVDLLIDQYELSIANGSAELRFNTLLEAVFEGERWSSLGFPQNLSVRTVGRRLGTNSANRIEWTAATGEVLNSSGGPVVASPLSDWFTDEAGQPLPLGSWNSQ